MSPEGGAPAVIESSAAQERDRLFGGHALGEMAWLVAPAWRCAPSHPSSTTSSALTHAPAMKRLTALARASVMFNGSSVFASPTHADEQHRLAEIPAAADDVAVGNVPQHHDEVIALSADGGRKLDATRQRVGAGARRDQLLAGEPTRVRHRDPHAATGDGHMVVQVLTTSCACAR